MNSSELTNIVILPFSAKKQQRLERDVRAIAQNRSETGLTLAFRLQSLAAAQNSSRAAANAEKLALCCEPRNIFVGVDLHGQHGDAFDGCGSLWACGLAFCPNCNAARAARHRRRVRDALDQLKPLVGLQWRFVTLTAPTQSSGLLDALAVFLRGWDLFRKRKLFVENVWAGWRGLEFTVTRFGNHAHIHALWLARKSLYPSHIRADWQDCIASAWTARGVDLSFGLGGAVVKVQELTAKRREGQGITKAIDAAVLETTKYVCKPDGWRSLSDSDLLDVGQCERFPRVFEAFGKARNFGEKHILDKQVLNDGKTSKLKSPEKLNIFEARNWRKAHLKRTFTAAQLTTLDGREF